MEINLFGFRGFTKQSSDTFDFRNPNFVSFEIGILADAWVRLALPALATIDSTVMVNPEQLRQYEELVNDKQINPKRIKGIRIITDNISQLSKASNWQSRDANGELASIVDYPINMLSPMQFQSRVVDIPFDKLLVGLNEFMIYEILPLTRVRMTFLYDDFALSNLLEKR